MLTWNRSRLSIDNEIGYPMFKVNELVTDKEIKQIILAGEAFSAIKEFVDDVNSGKLKPRATVKKFQSLLDKTS
jgi:hypothetical protein